MGGKEKLRNCIAILPANGLHRCGQLVAPSTDRNSAPENSYLFWMQAQLLFLQINGHPDRCALLSLGKNMQLPAQFAGSSMQVFQALASVLASATD